MIKQNRLYFIVIFVLLFLLSAFRNGLGTDYESYANLYTNPSFTNSLSFLFNLIFIYGLRLISTDSLLFFIVTAFVTNYLVLRVIYKESSIILFSVAIYVFLFYLSTFNLVRQFLALSLFFYLGLELIQKRKISYFFILIIIIAQIHFSIYVLILFLLFKDNKKSIYLYLVLWSISIMFVLFEGFQVSVIVSILNFLSQIPYIPKGITIWSENYTHFLVLGKSNMQLWMKNILLLVLFLSFSRFNDKKSMLFLNLFFFGIVMGNFLNVFNQLGNRIAYYGEFALILLMPYYVNMFKNNIKQLVFVSFLCFFILIGTYRFYIQNESEAIPDKWRFIKISK